MDKIKRRPEVVMGKMDVRLVVLSTFILVMSIESLYCPWLNFSWPIIVIVDLYFIYVIFYAARKSDVYKPDDWKRGLGIPNRVGGVFVFTFLYLSVIFSFSEIILHAKGLGNPTTEEAFYRSVMAITSFSHTPFPSELPDLQKLQMFQSFNGILLLTAAFGFLVARISTFREEVSWEDFTSFMENLDKKDVPVNAMATFKKLMEENKSQREEINKLQTELEEFKKKNKSG
ncbi:MAG: hypothetical protein R2819_01720 [Allomuricauda sp.]|uniref:hypothetical protein n=1 Tax=Muricauda brasiliensis TaxID=2162892 RepID=UPI00131F02FC|nr:hypothetical protein [Muricauda brasiliensis]